MIWQRDFNFLHCFMPDTYEITVGALLGPTQRQRMLVPQFQRGYEWKVEHVEAFWRDIIEFKKQRGLQGAPKKHFFGPIVILKKNDDADFELLDGQQRLATSTILLSVIRDAARAITTNEAADFAKDTQTSFILP